MSKNISKKKKETSKKKEISTLSSKTRTQTKSTPLSIRVQTAEGWKRSQIKRLKSAKRA